MFRFFGSIIFLCLFAFNNCEAHPFHTTTAEMEYNAATRRFEVSLKIPAADFAHVLRAGRRMAAERRDREANEKLLNADAKEQLDAKVVEVASLYLEKQFVVAMAGKPCRFEWVGSEDDQSSKWIYFELVLPTDEVTSGDLTLTNKVLCDTNSGQINTVVLLAKSSRVSIKTHDQNAVVRLPELDR